MMRHQPAAQPAAAGYAARRAPFTTLLSLEEPHPSFATEAVLRRLRREYGWQVWRRRWSAGSVAFPTTPPDLLLIAAPSAAAGARRAAAARAACPSSGIVIVERVDDPIAIAAALDAGADDVVCTSTGLDEFVARVRRLGARE